MGQSDYIEAFAKEMAYAIRQPNDVSNDADDYWNYTCVASQETWKQAAAAGLRVLPSMVKPLVWVHSYEGSNIHDTKCKYEIERHDSGGRLWRLTKGVTGGGAYIGHYPSAAIAQAAADTYNVADVMAALTGETL
jgi:hypothetical protein